MATKTISIDLAAYESLKKARRNRKESFSQVIKRAEWRKDLTSRELPFELNHIETQNSVPARGTVSFIAICGRTAEVQAPKLDERR